MGMNERINVNGQEYVSVDSVIQHLAKACLIYHYDGGDLMQTEYETSALDFVNNLLKCEYDSPAMYDAFTRAYVNLRYPEVFEKKES